MVGAHRDGEAGQVGDVLAQSQLAVDVLAGQRLVGRILCGQCGGPGGEALQVLRNPPVAEIACSVELAALVVERVADLVADHRADSAVVYGVIGLGVEKRRLQDRGWERDVAAGGVVVGVDGLRRGKPLLVVHRLAQLVEVALTGSGWAA
jgi:hypothetical protein